MSLMSSCPMSFYQAHHKNACSARRRQGVLQVAFGRERLRAGAASGEPIRRRAGCRAEHTIVGPLQRRAWDLWSFNQPITYLAAVQAGSAARAVAAEPRVWGQPEVSCMPRSVARLGTTSRTVSRQYACSRDRSRSRDSRPPPRHGYGRSYTSSRRQARLADPPR